MEEQKVKQIFEAIKSDDLKLFSSLLTEPSDFNLCFGRFPLLSCLYLYQSYNILSKFEARLLRIGKFDIVPEIFEIYKKFRTRAKKSLRIFANKDLICYPILMLTILDERILLTQNYKNLYKTVEITQILNKIYKINLNYDVNASTDKISLPRKKQSYKQVLTNVLISAFLMIVVLFSVFSVTFIGATSGIGTKNLPILISNEQELKTALGNGTKNYKLTTDITFSEEINVSRFSGSLDGDGHTLKVVNSNNPLIKTLTGTIKNLKIDCEEIEKEITQNFAIIAEKSSGIIENVEISLKIDVSFRCDEDTYLTVFAVENSGIINNSISTLSGNATNSGKTNCYVSGFVGKNSGSILRSKSMAGELVTDTVDISGIVISNSGTISYVENNIKLNQISDKEWHPNTSGIANSNSGVIEYSINNSDISSTSNLLQADQTQTFLVFAGGIACENVGKITSSRNFGNITASGEISNSYAGGIASMNTISDTSSAKIEYSKSKSKVQSSSKDGQAFAGGIAGFNYSSIDHSGFEGEILVDSTNSAFGGGIVGIDTFMLFGGAGFIGNGSVTNCYSSVKFNYLNADNSSKICYASIIGVLNTSSYPSVVPSTNNHYVKDSSFIYSIFVSMGSLFGTEDSRVNVTSHEKIEDIDSEVILNDEI